MEHCRFVSIDSSTTSSGLALWIDGELAESKCLQPDKKLRQEDRMIAMANLLSQQLNEWQPQVIFAETPQGHGANVKLARTLGEVLGVILGWAASHDCFFMEVNPSWWRKWNGWDQGGLKRPELKALSVSKAKERFGVDVNDDEADALNIGTAALNYFTYLEEKENDR